ncbi:ArsS family sensor histidine kinase [Campylobacter estrildidarum]|uniref:histidine kinase n=1 Tax=Campylobacter estrildidarum TaxID=2510189 RepID=A0A4U7BP43_9BACT|nr:ArsS family sensor histidine kinase [Campylobacter estrildidarum]TKX32015.1 sensor histidine kinase [Campylobacter estrildidarum]
MRKKYSISTKLVVLFVLTFFLVCILFIILLKIEENSYEKEGVIRQKVLVKNMLSSYNSNFNINAYFNNNNFSIIKNSNLKDAIKKNAKILFYDNDNQICQYFSLKYQNDLYLDIQCENFQNLYKENINDRVYNLLLVGFFFFSFLVVFMYFSVLKSLEPLKKLRKQVAKAANGKKFEFTEYQEDEIGKIAFEFKKAFTRSQELIESRQLFLRTIMHELKTPIGKGRIIAEMIKEQKQKERLIDIFSRMDSLINEFAKIENLFSKNHNLHFKPTHFSIILEEAKNYLMKDDFNKIVKIYLNQDSLINADMEIFPLILKNLIDNALKYSSDGTCKIYCYKDSFVIKNLGQALSEPIEYYFEAFTREKHQQAKGMGLGLYIVFEVCKLHNFEITYYYEKGKHCFKVFFGDKKNNDL